MSITYSMFILSRHEIYMRVCAHVCMCTRSMCIRTLSISILIAFMLCLEIINGLENTRALGIKLYIFMNPIMTVLRSSMLCCTQKIYNPDSNGTKTT